MSLNRHRCYSRIFVSVHWFVFANQFFVVVELALLLIDFARATVTSRALLFTRSSLHDDGLSVCSSPYLPMPPAGYPPSETYPCHTSRHRIRSIPILCCTIFLSLFLFRLFAHAPAHLLSFSLFLCGCLIVSLFPPP